MIRRFKRRSFLRAAGLSAASLCLAPALRRMVAEAQDDSGSPRTHLILLTGGNGWGHQGMSRDGGEVLGATVRSPTDWDLPEALSPLASIRERVSVLRSFRCPGDGDLHGSGWSTLTCVRGDGRNPNGVSLDRLVARGPGSSDVFTSVALGVAPRAGRGAPCASSDGPLQAFPAIGSPLDAYAAIFGGGDPEEARRRLASEQSLLDGMLSDAMRARSRLAGEEARKLDQLLSSLRDLERQLEGRLTLLETRRPPLLPEGDLERAGLQPTVLRAQAAIGANALAFGLTRVLHLSVLGFNDHNAGWGAIGHPGDAHENLMHVSGYSRDEATRAVIDIAKLEAELVVQMWQALEATPYEGGTMADRTLLLWVNSGGGKHHEGRNYHPAVLIGDAGGALPTGQYIERSDRPNLNQLYLSVANACGVMTDVFGRPEDCPGPLPELT